MNSEKNHFTSRRSFLASSSAGAIGFDGVYRPDHVPTLDGDSNDHPGYSTLGRLFAIGYIRGLQQAVYSQSQS